MHIESRKSFIRYGSRFNLPSVVFNGRAPVLLIRTGKMTNDLIDKIDFKNDSSKIVEF